MWGWILGAVGVGGALLYEETRPSGPTAAVVSSVVAKALATETDPAKLADFSASLATSYPTLAAQLSSRAKTLAPLYTVQLEAKTGAAASKFL